MSLLVKCVVNAQVSRTKLQTYKVMLIALLQPIEVH